MIEMLAMFGTFGEFIESNPMVVLVALGHAIAFIAWLVGLSYVAHSTRKDMDEYKKTLTTHVNNNDAHVNQLYIGTLSDRLDTVEETLRDTTKTIISGHKAIEEKIDRKFDALALKINGR